MAAEVQLVERRVRPRSFVSDDWLLIGGSAVASFSLVWLLYRELAPEPSIAGFAVWWFVAFAAMYWTAAFRLQGRLLAMDRLMSVLIASGAAVMLVPVFVIMGFVVYKGAGIITPHFFYETNQFCGQLDGAQCGGVGHAIVGTLEQVGIAILIAVPLAILCAVFLNEVGGVFKRPVRLFVDAMSGVPSIVAGLFIYAIWVIGLREGFSGFAASVALSILMLPTVTRTSEEVLRLVPDGLREGSLALGSSEWRTVWNVVLPTARSGLITAVILGVARAVGETAPLILTSFGASVMNANPLQGAQESLPHFVYQYIHYNPGSAPYQRAWAAAAVLTLLVLALFTSARLLGAATSIEARQHRASARDRSQAVREAAVTRLQRRMIAEEVAPAPTAAGAGVGAIAMRARRVGKGGGAAPWWLKAAGVAVAVALVVAAYAGAGFAFGQSRIGAGEDAYSAALRDENQVMSTINSVTPSLASSNPSAASPAALQEDKTVFAQLVSRSQDAQLQMQGDDDALTAAEAGLTDQGWLTALDRSALDRESARIAGLRKALADGRVLTGDYVQLFTFYASLADVAVDANQVAADVQAQDATATASDNRKLTTDLAKAVSLDKAPGLPAEFDGFLKVVQQFAKDMDAFVQALASGDPSALQSAEAALQSDNQKLSSYDFKSVSTKIADYYNPLIERFNADIARAAGSSLR